MKSINVLGTTYRIYYCSETKPENIPIEFAVCHGLEGLTCPDQKTIYLKNGVANHIIRHEIVHAFLFESGLDSQSSGEEAWSANEQVVDWIALQFPKMYKVFKQLGIEDAA